MINVIVSTIIWGLAIALFASILVTGGLPLGKKAEKKLAFLDKSTLYRKEQIILSRKIISEFSGFRSQ